MGSVLVINAAGRETRIALVEGGQIAEFYLERNKDRGVVGNIYKGRVTRVLPGMQAAFVDIGLDKAAFLYVGDVLYDPDSVRAQFELTEGEHDEEVPEVPDEDAPLASSAAEGQAPDAQTEGSAQEAGAMESATDASNDGNDSEDGDEEAELQADAPDESTDVPQEMQGSAEEQGATSAPQEDQGGNGSSDSPAVASAEPGPVPADNAGVAAAPAKPAHGQGGGPRGGAPAQGNRQRRDGRPRDHRNRPKTQEKQSARIEDLLKPGQEVLVQISKDPIGTKGARTTCHISIPGRHLVFMPTIDHVGISRRIGNEKERRRLREIVDRLRPPGTGFIVRTVAENIPSEKLEADIRFLLGLWNNAVKRTEERRHAGLVHADLDLTLRATRDLFAKDVEKLVVDDRDEFERVSRFLEAQDPALKERVVLHDNEEPIFDAYGIEDEIKRASARKVWLKSGGYLIIDQAEALTAIDVNSGRYVGKKSLVETITRINTEAAKEIVYQLRLRNIGGIIICDFIDMEKSQNRDKVYRALQEALGRDKAKTNVLRISELGLVEMTRKRVRESLGRTLYEDCNYCEGQGLVKSTTTVAYEIFRELRRSAGAYKDPTLVISCSSDVANVLLGEERDELRHLMDRYNKSIHVKSQTAFHREHFDIYARAASGEDIAIATSGDTHVVGGAWGGPKRTAPPEPREQRGGRGRDRGRDRKDRNRNRGDRGPEGRKEQAGSAPPPAAVKPPVEPDA